jgi:hypothetical protein
VPVVPVRRVHCAACDDAYAYAWCRRGVHERLVLALVCECVRCARRVWVSALATAMRPARRPDSRDRETGRPGLGCSAVARAVTM